MTGIRSWNAAVTAFGVVVSIEHDFTYCPLESFQRSHSPANVEQLPVVDFKTEWLLQFSAPELHNGQTCVAWHCVFYPAQ